jgi:hypothetical protein
MEKYVQMVTWVNGKLVSWDPEWEDPEESTCHADGSLGYL